MSEANNEFNLLKINKVGAVLQRYVDEGRIAGAVGLVARRGRIVGLWPVGFSDLETQIPMESDTIFRLYSLTKPVTSVAFMMLAEAGLVGLEQPVKDVLPAFNTLAVWQGPVEPARPVQQPMTFRHLLTHTSGLSTDALAGSPLATLYRQAGLREEGATLAEMTNKVAALPLLFEPGSRWHYGVSTDVLARAVEVVAGPPLDVFFRQRIFEPLGMTDTGFYVPDEHLHRLATMYSRGLDGKLKQVDQAMTSPYRQRPTLLSGSAGLVSTVLDYSAFARMLLNEGQHQGVRLLQPETVRLMTTNQLAPSLLPYGMPWANTKQYTAGSGFGLGFRVMMDVAAAGGIGSVGEYGWAGLPNTFLWNDSRLQMTLLLFTQALPFMAYPLHSEFKEAVYAAAD